jgi:hypothetical protein
LIGKLKPGTPKTWLYLTAGLMWSAVGIWLSYLAYGWLRPVAWLLALGLTTVGVLLALTIYAFGFSGFAKRNITRISVLPTERPCVFAFQSWSSYPLVVVMISLGIFLRKYSPMPKPYLAAMYIGIGGSLFLASFHYYHVILKQITKERGV